MNFVAQITKCMSLRDPQQEALSVLDEISSVFDYKTAQKNHVMEVASEKSLKAKPIVFDTGFPSFCFALATGVGKTRLMGACIYYLWKSKGYRNFFILAPGMTIYDKLRVELQPSHPKYMFVGLSDFSLPTIYDGDNYLQFRAEPGLFDEKQAHIFLFNIGKIFTARTDTEFKFHRFNEYLGDSFSAILQRMDDLVILMDESHRYRGEASLQAINHLSPALGLEFTATPKYTQNVIYSFGLAEAINRYVKVPTVVTRTNLTTADEQEIERLKLMDGMARHEIKKGRLAEYCSANNKETVKPFVLISTKDTIHAGQVRTIIESDSFCQGRYKGKVIEIHSKQTGVESEENIQRLLQVEQPTSNVEVVIHVNMLKEGWDVKNLYTIIPLRASVSDILTEQTIGRGLRLPFGEITGDSDLDELEIISHDQYAKLVQEAKNNPLFRFKEISEQEFRPVKTVPVQHAFIDMDRVIDRLQSGREILFTSDLSNEKRLDEIVNQIVREQAAAYESHREGVKEGQVVPSETAQEVLFPLPDEEKKEIFDEKLLAGKLKERLRLYAEKAIDVPEIVMDVLSERRLAPFRVSMNVGPFELVEQRLQSTELASGKTKIGNEMEILKIENPRGFLAGRLIDVVEEMDVPTDKDFALKLVDDYLSQIEKPPEDIPKIIHLYRDVILQDLKRQVEMNLEENTEVKPHIRSGFVKWRSYSKTVLEKEGIVPYTTDVPRLDIRKYLFTDFNKSFYSQVPFDSTPEKIFAAVLEQDNNVFKWIRPPEGNVPIFWRGRNYTPDFIVEIADRKFIVEIKAKNEIYPTIGTEVLEKARATVRWCGIASAIKGSKPWEYRLISEETIHSGITFRFAIGQSVRF